MNRNAQHLPPEKIHAIATEAMTAFYILYCRRKAKSMRQFYGFLPQDVVDLHFHKKGYGDGLWFRVCDGRVFDHRGKTSENSFEMYSPTGLGSIPPNDLYYDPRINA
ncbi:MAG: hypothetical protein ACAH80_17565 [Alphaproteobacteria bacterium]